MKKVLYSGLMSSEGGLGCHYRAYRRDGGEKDAVLRCCSARIQQLVETRMQQGQQQIHSEAVIPQHLPCLMVGLRRSEHLAAQGAGKGANG